MPTKFIDKSANPAAAYTGSHAGIGVDSDNDFLYYNSGGTKHEVVDVASAQTITGDKTFTGTVVMSGVVTTTEAGDGTVGAPSYSFSADLDNGMYRIGTNNVGLAAAGAKVLDISATGLGVVGTALAGDGTVSLPSLGFSADTDSGLYRIGANNIGVTVGGVKVVDVGAAAVSVVGSITSADATTPIVATASGKTNTGYLSLPGKTSGSLKVLPADAMAQIVTIAPAAQTSGASTLTIPDQAGVSSNFVFDTLAQTLTNKTLTSPVVNTPTIVAPSGSASTGVMITKRVLFTENATNTLHTGTVALPAGAWLHDLKVTSSVLWTGGTATMKVGDSVDDDGYFVGINLKATDLLVNEELSITDGDLWGGKEGAYLVAATGQRGPTATNFGPYQAAGTSIIGVVTVGTPATTVGRTWMSVTYSVGEALSAVASA